MNLQTMIFLTSFRIALSLNTMSLYQSVFEMPCTLPQYPPLEVLSAFGSKNGCSSAIPGLSWSLFDLDFAEMVNE